MKRYFVTSDGEEWEVGILEEDGRTFAVVGDRRVAVDLQVFADETAGSLLVGDESHSVSFDTVAETLLVGVEGRTYRLRVEDERDRLARAALRATGAVDHQKRIVSMMPGIVREVRVSAGDSVTAGQPLVILEAMKMENEIRALADGEVKSVHAAPGTTVGKGDLLVVLE